MSEEGSSVFPIPALVPLQIITYRVARFFCGSIILRIGDFCFYHYYDYFAKTNFCNDCKRLNVLAGN